MFRGGEEAVREKRISSPNSEISFAAKCVFFFDTSFHLPYPSATGNRFFSTPPPTSLQKNGFPPPQRSKKKVDRSKNTAHYLPFFVRTSTTATPKRGGKKVFCIFFFCNPRPFLPSLPRHSRIFCERLYGKVQSSPFVASFFPPPPPPLPFLCERAHVTSHKGELLGAPPSVQSPHGRRREKEEEKRSPKKRTQKGKYPPQEVRSSSSSSWTWTLGPSGPIS